MQADIQARPKCPRCGGDVFSRGKEIYAKPPHHRHKWSCKVCGHPFADKAADEVKEVPAA